MNAFEDSLTRYLTPEQLALIRKKKLGIGGAGGLGSNVCVALARTGFRHFEIIDKDIVEASNLNRQDYTLADMGRPKVEALKERLLTINPDADITVHHREWTAQAAEELFLDADIIVEAFDQAAVKAAFVQHYSRRVKFIVSGNGMAGLDVATSAMAVRKAGNIFIVGDGATSTDDNHPPLAPRVMQCAAKMAEVVLVLSLSAVYPGNCLS